MNAADDAPVFTRSSTVGPVGISQEQLIADIRKLEALAKTANAAIPPDKIEHSLILTDGVNSMRVPGDFTTTTLSGAPPVATSATFSYRAMRAPVSNIEIRLHDLERRITVEGTSAEQVEAVANAAATAVSTNTILFGGFLHRSIAGVVILLIALALPGVAFLVRQRAFKWAFNLSGPLLSLSIWILPWDRWFPGTAVYRGDAAFIVRHAALISFVGLVATVATFFGSIALSGRLGRSGSKATP